MSNISDLHDILDANFEDCMEDIRVANKSANCIADRVGELRSRFEGHEVRVYNMRRTFFVSLRTKTAWRGSIKDIRNRLKQGLGQLSDQLSRSERDYDYGVSLLERVTKLYLSTDIIYVDPIL